MNNKYAPLIFLLLTVVIQFISMTFVFGLTQFNLPLSMLCLIHSIIGGYLSFFFRMSKPWIFINFIIPAGIFVSQALPGYGSLWLILLIASACLFLPTFWTRVPYYPSSEKTYDLVASVLPKDKAFRFVDIGCGNAKLLRYLADRFPNGQFEGFELSLSAFIAAKWISAKSENVNISFRNYWKASFADYDFIYAFLSPVPMPEIEKKAKAEVKHGSSLLVNSFALPELKASKSMEINHSNQSKLYIYEF